MVNINVRFDNVIESRCISYFPFNSASTQHGPSMSGTPLIYFNLIPCYYQKLVFNLMLGNVYHSGLGIESSINF